MSFFAALLLIGLFPAKALSEFRPLSHRRTGGFAESRAVRCSKLIKVGEAAEQIEGGLGGSINRYVLRLGGAGKDGISVPCGVSRESLPSGAGPFNLGFGNIENDWRIVSFTGECGMQSRGHAIVLHSKDNFPAITFYFNGRFGVDPQPRSLADDQCIAGNGQLPLENKSRPESGYRDYYSQDSYRPISGLGLFAWGVPPVAEPVENAVKELGWGWRILFVFGLGLCVVCGLIIWKCVHLIYDIDADFHERPRPCIRN
jgi:hypothetical protein